MPSPPKSTDPVEKEKASPYDEAIRSILEHSQIAEPGLLGAQDILAIAEKDLPSDGGTATARFDVTKGVWRVLYTVSGRSSDVSYYDSLGRKMNEIK